MAGNRKKCLRNIAILLSLMSVLFGCGSIAPLKIPSESKISADDNWLTLGKDNQHRHYSNKNIVPPLEVVWRARVKSIIPDHPLAIGDNILAPTIDGQLYQLNYQSGQFYGRGNLGPAIEHIPTIQKGILYTGFSLGEETLLGFNLETTRKTLQRKYTHITTSPIYWDNKLFFGTYQGRLICTNVGTGEKIWEFTAKAPIQSSPAIQDQLIIFGDDSGWLYALDATSGLKLWETQLKGNIFSHPVIDDSLVFIGTLEGNLYAVRYTNGKIIWKQRFSGAIYSSPSVFENMMYIGNNDHKVIALRKATGEIIWTFGTDGIVNTVPLPSPDYLYVASWDKHLYVVNRANGKLLFKMDLEKPLKSSPIIYRDVLLVQSANGHLYALANGKYIQSRREKE
jgi:outer membrane protein assembly factor BamB